MSLETKLFVAIGNVSLDKTDTDYSPGGPVLYSTLAARRNGWKPVAVTSFGQDFYQAKPPLDGIDVRVQPVKQTLTLQLNYTSKGREISVIKPGSKLRTEHLMHARGADVLFICPNLDEYTETQALELIRQNPSAYVALCPQGWLRHMQKGTGLIKPKKWEHADKILPYVDLLALSWEDIGNNDSLVLDYNEMVGNYRTDKGIISVTNGKKPNILVRKRELIEMPTMRAREIDATGAGDVFAAEFAMLFQEKYQRLKGLTDSELNRIAVHALAGAQLAAAFKVEKKGTAGLAI